ncbi:Mss4-like protein [Mycena amicta]|nr:Mss4-like protein [Mycena amicta]
MSDPALVEYKGNCHCGAFRFSFKAPEITKKSECDCSICFKNGYIWQRPSEGTFVVEKGDENETLVSYEFGKKTLAHKFCPTCGTSVFGRHSADAVAVNIRAVQAIDVWSLQPGDIFKGSEVGDAYQLPAPVTPSKPVPDGATTYHGNCHCGAMAYTLIHPDKIQNACLCNCSICTRDGVAWTYPPTADITFRGVPEFVTEYTFGKERTYHGFCKVCGVAIYERFIGLNDEGKNRALRQALNVRTMNVSELDFESLEFELHDGRARPPIYAVPA